MPKYLDQTGLTTFKSKLDTTYAKKADVYDKTAADGLLSAKANSADVYTKAQVDSAIAGAGLPTITIALSQVVSQSPLQIQLTNEQYATMNGHSVILDVTALGMPVVVADYGGQYTNPDNAIDYLNFVIVQPVGYGRKFQFKRIFVNVSTKVAGWDDAYPQYAEQAGEATYTFSVQYETTAPTFAFNNGVSNTLGVVVLSSEPATRYDGYLYIITGSN